MNTSFSASSMAAHLLAGSGLGEWHIGFLTVAIQETADGYGEGNVTEAMCMNELLQMHSQHRSSLEPVARAVAGQAFEISRNTAGGYTLVRHERVSSLTADQFTRLVEECGWGTDAHRVALRAVAVPC